MRGGRGKNPAILLIIGDARSFGNVRRYRAQSAPPITQGVDRARQLYHCLDL